MNPLRFEVAVQALRTPAPAVRELLLQRVDGRPLPPHAAGAHLPLWLQRPGQPTLLRHYSVLGGLGLQDDAPSQVRIAVQAQPGGEGSAWIHQQLAPGSRLHIGAPVDGFRLDWRHRRVLLIAGGIGITPLYAMARSLQRRGCDWQLLALSRGAGRLPYRDELAALAGVQAPQRLRLVDTRTEPRPDWPALLAALHPEVTVYVCGPGSLIHAVQAAAAALGWPPARLRSESFDPAAPPPDARAGLPAGPGSPPAPPMPQQALQVRLQRSGRQLPVAAGQSVLDALLQAGEPLFWDCRRGECGLCALPVLQAEGGIAHRDQCLDPAERARDARLCPCVSRPRGDLLVLDA